MQVQFDENKHTRITAKLETIIQVAYALSIPAGMGHLHYRPGGLKDNEIKELLGQQYSPTENCVADLDYVFGRAVKLTVYKDIEGGSRSYFVRTNWFDHTDKDLEMLKQTAEQMG